MRNLVETLFFGNASTKLRRARAKRVNDAHSDRMINNFESKSEWTLEDALGTRAKRHNSRSKSSHVVIMKMPAARVVASLRDMFTGESPRDCWLLWSERRSFFSREMLLEKLNSMHLHCDLDVCEIILKQFGEYHNGTLCIGYTGFVRIITGDYNSNLMEAS